MPEESVVAPVTTEEVVPEPVVQPEVKPEVVASQTPPVEPTVAQTPNWLDEFDKMDPKMLRANPKFAGMLGSEVQKVVQERERIREKSEAEKRRAETEDELLKFSEENMEYIKEHYPKAAEHLESLKKQRSTSELDSIRTKTRDELATAIGRSYTGIPEWADLTDADHQTLAEAILGKTDDEVLPIFAAKALDLVAERRANKRMSDWKEKELAREREVIRQEEAAKLLQNTESPVIEKPKGQPAKIDIMSMSDAEFEEYAKKHGLKTH